MAYPIKIRDEALNLKRRGYSLSEINLKLKVPKTTISDWSRNIKLNKKAEDRLLSKIKRGQLLGAESKRLRVSVTNNRYLIEAKSQLNQLSIDKISSKFICSLLYWCEGAKDQYGGVRFTNSDPLVIKTFLKLFRNSFDLDERKFRVGLHLHKYHNINKQLEFWSQETNIPKKQFIRPYLKSNTGHRVRKNYPGCATIYYYSNDISRLLLMTGKAFLTKYGGIVQW